MQPVKVFGMKFESIAEAHRNLTRKTRQDVGNVSYGAVYYRVLADGLQWAPYQIDGPRRPLRIIKTRKMLVHIRGRHFSSFRDAAQYLGVTASTVRYYVYSDHHPDCYLKRRVAV